MPWFIYNSIKNYSAWEANRSFLVPFCKLVNWCFQLFFLTICRWSQVMHYDFFSEVNVNKRSAQRDKLKEKFSETFSGYIFFDWCLFISADFRILRNDIKINFTNCLSKILESFPVVFQLFELNFSIEISLIQFL